ncbi:hypothetical protein FHR83_007010 [Actinoplanes campanulatus]|uniref:Uncharacterized protein n=1 Tax=Actinoplanes campanulatus TaxID=113559 RepID=A0A7W5ANW7_9ACTN|nr:hypothetical protein [Actinoplanes campanulatus]MBB3099304.1 hypothetical protein [Actinoplanes campanulatus]GGN40557.1 hypothetical protein GCM10010109_69810 [Actinoplanes campanulatus]GID40622.1 hypothetical protein Aca09nite_71280 [Actinoplanes campanulatus]
MAGNAVTLEFAGDATRLQRAAQQATEATDSVARAANDAGSSFQQSSQDASRFEQRMGNLGAATAGLTDAVDSLAGGMQAVADIQDYARQRAQRLEQAETDVEQAMADTRQAAIDLEQSIVDLNQAKLDGQQASLDLDQALIDEKQAILDAQTAVKEYNEAVAEHGKGSDEAKQAALDLEQAQQDQAQAMLDADQAAADATQAQTDLKQATEDGKQANIDARQSQIDLNDAMHEANPPQLQEWADKLALITPLLTAVIGVTSLVTAAQWAWNAAQLANPLTWIILGIVALIAIIVLLVANWDWVAEKAGQAWDWIKEKAIQAWDYLKTIPGKIADHFEAVWRGLTTPFRKAWDWVKDKSSQVWEYLKKLPGKIADAFSSIGTKISAPFRAAFNAISRAWNSTVGQLSWTVPGWVPGVGGSSVSAPKLPTFHTGGKIPGLPGQEVPFLGLAGETVLPAGRSPSDSVQVVVMLDSDVLIEGLARQVGRRGGNVQLVLGGRNAA